MLEKIKEKFEAQVAKNPLVIFIWVLIIGACVGLIYLVYWMMTLGIH